MASTVTELLRRRFGGSRSMGFDWETFAKGVIERRLDGEYSIPSGITIIGERSFSAFVSISPNLSFIFPEGVTTVSANAFNASTAIASVTFPSTLTTIGSNAFANCSRITMLIFNGTTPPTLSNTNALAGTGYSFPIYVPDSAVNSYKTANIWNSYASRIFPISDLTT